MEKTPVTLPQEAYDAEHLRLLTIFHYIDAACTAAFSSIFIFHFTFMVVLACKPDIFPAPKDHSDGFPTALAMTFAVILGAIILLGWILAILTAYAGKCIQKRKHHAFVCVMAGLNCFFVPRGTVLGVCTFLVLARPSVKPLFRSNESDLITTSDKSGGGG